MAAPEPPAVPEYIVYHNCEVRLHGLKRADLNGRAGRAFGPNDAGRYEVTLCELGPNWYTLDPPGHPDSWQKVNVKPENLEMHPESKHNAERDEERRERRAHVVEQSTRCKATCARERASLRKKATAEATALATFRDDVDDKLMKLALAMETNFGVHVNGEEDVGGFAWALRDEAEFKAHAAVLDPSGVGMAAVKAIEDIFPGAAHVAAKSMSEHGSTRVGAHASELWKVANARGARDAANALIQNAGAGLSLWTPGRDDDALRTFVNGYELDFKKMAIAAVFAWPEEWDAVIFLAHQKPSKRDEYVLHTETRFPPYARLFDGLTPRRSVCVDVGGAEGPGPGGTDPRELMAKARAMGMALPPGMEEMMETMARMGPAGSGPGSGSGDAKAAWDELLPGGTTGKALTRPLAVRCQVEMTVEAILVASGARGGKPRDDAALEELGDVSMSFDAATWFDAKGDDGGDDWRGDVAAALTAAAEACAGKKRVDANEGAISTIGLPVAFVAHARYMFHYKLAMARLTEKERVSKRAKAWLASVTTPVTRGAVRVNSAREAAEIQAKHASFNAQMAAHAHAAAMQLELHRVGCENDARLSRRDDARWWGGDASHRMNVANDLCIARRHAVRGPDDLERMRASVKACSDAAAAAKARGDKKRELAAYHALRRTSDDWRGHGVDFARETLDAAEAKIVALGGDPKREDTSGAETFSKDSRRRSRALSKILNGEGKTGERVTKAVRDGDADVSACDFCGTKAIKMKTCSRCMRAHFCGPACIRAGWGNHKEQCGKWAAEAEAAAKAAEEEESDRETDKD